MSRLAMYRKCSYFRCKNKGNMKSMFHFPANEPERLEIWVRNCGNMTITHLPPKRLLHKFVCIDHFDRNYIIFRPDRTRHTLLKRDAVPKPYKEEELQTEMCQDPEIQSHSSPQDALGVSYKFSDREDKCKTCTLLKQHGIDIDCIHHRHTDTDINRHADTEKVKKKQEKLKKPKKVPEKVQDGCTCRVSRKDIIDIDCELMKTNKHNINVSTEDMLISGDFGCIRDLEDDESGKETLLSTTLLGHMPKEPENDKEDIETDILLEVSVEEVKLEGSQENKLKLEEETPICTYSPGPSEEDPLKDVEQNENSLLDNINTKQNPDKVSECLFLYDDKPIEELCNQDSLEEMDNNSVSDCIDLTDTDPISEVSASTNNTKAYSYKHKRRKIAGENTINKIKEEPQNSMDTEDASVGIKEESQCNTEVTHDAVQDLQCATGDVTVELPCKTEDTEDLQYKTEDGADNLTEDIRIEASTDKEVVIVVQPNITENNTNKNTLKQPNKMSGNIKTIYNKDRLNNTIKKKSKKNLIDLVSNHEFSSETQKMFTLMQLKRGTNDTWSKDEETFCLNLYRKSPAAYNFLLNLGIRLLKVEKVSII